MPGSTKIDLSKNQVLAALPEVESKRLLPHLGLVSFGLNEVLYNSGDPYRYLYFPQSCTVSWLVVLKNGTMVEVGMVGDEGMVGIRGLFGAKISQNVAVIQLPGDCLRIKKEVLQSEFKRGGVLQDRLLRYARYFMSQIAQTAACNRIHRLEQRLCRWLLITHNRAGRKDEFPMTHEFLSHMLGTPRSEVTLAAGILRKAGLVRYRRGKMTILDRKGLEADACECYRIVHDELTEPF
jgi:CRP-like cAMP-binding protein